MSYIITKSNGQTLITLQDGTLDTTKTSITLVGKNYPGYGSTLNQNLVRMLENFANSTSPTNPLVGQVWYNTSTGRLNVYNGSGFKPHSATVIATARPTTNASGDFWFKSDTGQLYVYNGTDFDLIGPTVSNSNIIAADITATGDLTATNGIFTGNVDVTGTVTAGGFKISGGTSGRVLYTTTAGLLTTEAGFEYNASTDTLTVGNLDVTGTTAFGTVEFDAGSAATPSITTTGDTNNGIYFPALDTVGITTGGTQRLAVSSAGVKIYATNGAHVGFAAAGFAGSSSITYSLPARDGLAGYALTTDGAGTTSWSANPGFTGSRGPQGPQGPQGVAGFTGSAAGGFTGSVGIGFTGSAGGGGGGGGFAGSAGPQGFVGSRGPQGPQGVAGPQGPQGFVGSQGTGVTFASNSTNTNRYVLFTDNTVDPLTNIYYNSVFVVNPSTGTVTATDFAATSDIRFKDISGPMTNALAKINTLRGVHYKWNENGKVNGMIDTSNQVGVIAQEVERVLPEAVENYNGALAVKYDKLVPLLIEAVKELTNKVSSLEQQLANKNTTGI